MKLGTKQKMTVERVGEHGAFLAETPGDRQTVLLPGSELRREHRELETGDEFEVFLYKDTEDRPTATLKTPKIELGGFAPLKVKTVTGIGAFLDWGLDKDLLLPYSEQTVKVMQGRDYLVSLYEDKSGRLAATMKVYPLLATDSKYKKGDWTEGYVYQINPELGAFLAVDNRYNGMIRKEDLNETVKNGRTVRVRVTGIRKDGKLMLSPVKKAYKEIGHDAESVLTALNLSRGFLPYNDKSDAEEIRQAFGISKGAFKKALGHLLKEGLVEQTEDGIRAAEKKRR